MNYFKDNSELLELIILRFVQQSISSTISVFSVPRDFFYFLTP